MRAAPLPGSNSETVRRDNLSAVLREVHLAGHRSRSELVARTGLNRSTVGAIVTELVDAGLAREERADSLGAPGRPSPLVHAAGDGAVVLAIGLAVHSLSAAIVGLGGVIHERARIERDERRLSLDDTLRDLTAMCRPLLDRPVVRDRLVGVGVAAVGPVRSVDGFVHFAPNLGWTAVPLADVIADTFHLDVPVAVRNEADLSARAEHLRGAGVGIDDLVYLSCEVGVGGGIVVGGRPLVGSGGYAGEVGHMTVDPDGRPCGCGSRGCWETEVGERAMLRNAGRDPDGGPAAVEALLDDLARGDATARTALDSVARWLGIGLAGLVNVFDPRIVVLGGWFGRMAPCILPGVRHELDARALALTRAPVPVVPGRLGTDAPLIGAAERALEPLLADPLRHAPRLRAKGAAMA